ncbi:hypothetical protein BC567DRAFT_66254 [Phyllosticta citribraziliensis]
MSEHASKSVEDQAQKEELQPSTDVKVELLRKALSIVEHVMPKDGESTAARLCHPDLNFGNIFVDEKGHIKSVIGWRGAWVGPLFATHPPTKPPWYRIERCSSGDTYSPEQFINQLKFQGYGKEIEQFLRAKEARDQEEDKVRKNPVTSLMAAVEQLASGYTLPLRHFLVAVQRSWNRFSTKDPCPYSFTEEEIKEHFEEAEDGTMKEQCMMVAEWI